MRKQNLAQADKRAFQEYNDYAFEDPHLHPYPGEPVSLSRPNLSTNASFATPQSRRRSQSSASSTYGYSLPHMPPHMRKPRPIIVASAIEKSDFRTHLDGMSSHLRGKLGGLIKGKKDNSPEKARQRPGTSTTISDFGSRSDNLTPSIGAVPSLIASTTPSEAQDTYSTGHHSHSTSAPRQRQQQESVIHKIRRFEGGGKLPQLGWKSLSNVRTVMLHIQSDLLTVYRILNYGMRMGTHSSTCTCEVLEQSHRHRSASIPESSNEAGLNTSSTCYIMSRSQTAGRNSIPMTPCQEARLLIMLVSMMAMDLLCAPRTRMSMLSVH